ncbi:MAG TPA: ROK family glucokinase [Anaerolineae bacterium]|nr:ROK family glucokinase [Anaerolineae bacterium]
MIAKQIAIGIDIGGTKIAAMAVDVEGRILSSLKIGTPGGTPDDIVTAVSDLIERLTESVLDAGEVVGIGLAVAGTINWKEGIVVQSPNLPFSNIRLRSIIESKFGLSTFMDNDGNLATLGEKYYGAAWGAQNIIGLTLGTGIGAGIIIDGCLYRGATGSAAEIGHMVIQATGPQCTCGSYGCFEEMASGRALLRLAKEKALQDRESLILKLAGGSVEEITGPMVTEAAQRGDKTALDVFSEIGFWLGIGINNVINIFNPELVVIGGGMADAGELVLSPVRKVVGERTLHPNKEVAKVVLADLGNQAGAMGAAALVFDELSI